MYAASAVRAIQPSRIQIILSQRSRPREPFEAKCQTMEKERNKCGGQQRESMSKLELISRCKLYRGLAVFWVLMSRAKHSAKLASFHAGFAVSMTVYFVRLSARGAVIHHVTVRISSVSLYLQHTAVSQPSLTRSKRMPVIGLTAVLN